MPSSSPEDERWEQTPKRYATSNAGTDKPRFKRALETLEDAVTMAG